MKKLERIFLYSVLAILFFYVFLADGNVESQVAIQEEVRVRRITIVNSEGQPVIVFWTSEDGGVIDVNNKDGARVVRIMANEENSGLIGIGNKEGNPFISMGANEGGGMIGVRNKDGTSSAIIAADENGGIMGIYNKDVMTVSMEVYKDDGAIVIYNKEGKRIGGLP